MINGFKRFRSTGLVLLFSMFMAGCELNEDSSTSSDAEHIETSQAVIWYLPEFDAYYKFLNNIIYSYRCSINNGYKLFRTQSGFISEESITFTDNEAPVTNDIEMQDGNNGLIIDDDFSYPFKLVTDIPLVCDGDAVEITYFSPEEVEEGVETNFVVNFDYRLASAENAVIDLGFTTEKDTFIIAGDKFEITERGTSSGSLTARYIPTSIEGGFPFQIHITMYEPTEGEELIYSIAGDEKTIIVNPQ
jgi:hypothetical protein